MAKKEESIGFNVNKFVETSEESKDHYLEKTMVVKTEEVNKNKKSRRKNNNTAMAVQNAAPPVPASSMSYIQESIPYTSLYAETNQQLDESINALKMLGNQVVQELQTVRGSKTLRNKYGIINDLSMTATTITNAMISAIKEKNNTATQASRFELDRMKNMKSMANEEDDNQRIANMYDAFVNTPVGVGGSPAAMLGPSMQDMILPPANPGFSHQVIGGDNTAAWEQSLSPAENRMLLEAKGTIETVVVYDSNSGSRWYDVIDKQTRQPVPNVEKPDPNTAYDLDINVRGGYAKDSNRGTVYPLIVLNNGDGSINEY